MKHLIFILLLAGLLHGSGQKKVYLFYTNDLHGNIEAQQATYMNPDFPPQLGGAASTQTILNTYRARAAEEGAAFLLLDAGNFFSGPTKIGRASNGLAIIDYMNQAGYDAISLGNNDFDAGPAVFSTWAQKANFPILAANLESAGTANTPAGIKRYVLIEKQGIKFGVLGIVSKSAEQADNPKNVAGLQFTSELDAARSSVKALREAGAEVIIALANLGLPYDPRPVYEVQKEVREQNILKRSYINTMELAAQVQGIDVVLSGGFNRGYDQPWEDPSTHTLCFQNYANGGNLGMVMLKIDTKTGSLAGYQLPSREQGLLLLSEDEFWPDAKMDSVIRDLASQYGPAFDQVIGVTHNTLYRSVHGESPMADLMCDAMLAAMPQATLAFNNYSGMRRDIAIGPITPRDLAGVFPFGNKIVLVKVEGHILKDLFEASVVGSFAGVAVSGCRVVYDKSFPDGKRIVSVEINGQPLEENRLYTVATTSYLAEGNAGMSKLAFLADNRFEYTDVLVREAVEAWIREHSPLSIELDGRWQAK